MYLSCLRIVNLRSIKKAELIADRRLNIIVGPNGSGKTTFLEAIHIVHCGRSFRTASFLDLVREGEDKLAINGEIHNANSGCEVRLFKVRKQQFVTDISVDGQVIKSASALSKLLPLLTFDANSFGVLEGSPKLRRSLIDRAVFHVESIHVQRLQRYSKALQHRNRLLKSRSNHDQFTFWETELAETSEDINRSRQTCVEALNKLLSDDSFSKPFGSIVLDYYPGWESNSTLSEILVKERQRDLSQGTTQRGPHKAEIKIKLQGRNVSRTASRGQIKIVVLTIITAIAEFIYKKTNHRPLLLIDDIAAELDSEWVYKAIERVAMTGTQAFITATTALFLKSIPYPFREFHVEQGNIVDTYISPLN